MFFDCWNVHWIDNVCTCRSFGVMKLRRIRFLWLQRRHNGRDGVSNPRHHECLLNRLFRHQPRKTSKLRVTGLCEGNSSMAGEFPAHIQRASTPKCFHLMTSSWYHQCDLTAFNCGRFHRMLKVIILYMNLDLRLQSHPPRVIELIYANHKKKNSPISSLQFGPWIIFVLNIDVPYHPAVVQLQWQWNVKGVMVMNLSLRTALQVEVMTTFRAHFIRMIQL